MKHTKLLDFLIEHKIAFELYEHAPFKTVKEGKHWAQTVPGAHSKNLFLKDKKETYFLLSLLDHKQVDLKALSKLYGRGGLSFCSEAELLELLDLLPGSVTPYGLISDEGRKIEFLLDRDFLRHSQVNFHPLVNDKTIAVAPADFLRFCELAQHPATLIDVPYII